MNVQIEESWKRQLTTEFEKDYFVRLTDYVRAEYRTTTIYPPGKLIFNAFNLCPFDRTKVVIIGQDPYHVKGQADGLAFSCHNNTPQPSLRNIFKEIHDDLGIDMSTSTDLTPWAKQGVVLLNTSLSVVEHLPASHSNKLWHKFTTEIVKVINELDQPIVFMLWGNHAKSFLPILNNPNHLVLSSAHPSPFSAYNGFFGNKHFSKTNDFLTKNNIEAINWKI